MRKLSKLLAVTAVVGISAAGVTLDPAAQASEPDAVDVTVPLNRPAAVEDAIRLADAEVGKAISLKVEAPGMVGEYFLESHQTPEEYLQWFEEQWGTKPKVVAVTLEVPAHPAPDKGPRPSDEPPILEPSVDVPEIIETGLPAFESEIPVGGEAREQLAELDAATPEASTENPTISAALLSEPQPLDANDDALANFSVNTAAYNLGANWKPREMEVRVERVGGRTYISQYANWRGGTTPAARPQREDGYNGGPPMTVEFGMEFDVSFYSDSVATGLRPACLPGFEDQFLAKNNSFNWGISVGQSSLASNSLGGGNIQGYADTFDWADNCEKQSLAVGIKRPWLIPQNGRGYHSVLISINAENGNVSSNRLGATVQLVDDKACQLYPGTSYTDCMGDYLYAPAGIDNSRLVLKENRRWVANPNKCWVSNGQGNDEPLLTQWNTRSGCYE